MGPCGPSGSFLWLGLGASQLLLFSGHLGIPDQAWLKVSPGVVVVGGIACVLLSFHRFLVSFYLWQEKLGFHSWW